MSTAIHRFHAPSRSLPFIAALSAALAASLSACGTSQADVPPAAAAAPAGEEQDPVARGEYLVRIGGCNDCHTPGYAERQGDVDKSQWLVGTPLGYKGPWGTTYAANLRLKLADMDEAQWLDYSAKLHTRPIMPDFNVRAMSQADRRAIYRFVHSLGKAGAPAPAYLPPGQQPPAPYLELVLPPMAGAAPSAQIHKQ